MWIQGEMKTRRVPSGDQAGWQEPSGISVTLRGSLPSMFITQIWVVPERSEAKAICPAPPPMGVAVGCGEGGGTAGREVGEGIATVGDRRAVGGEVGGRDVGEAAAGEVWGVGVALEGAAATTAAVASLGSSSETAKAGQVG